MKTFVLDGMAFSEQVFLFAGADIVVAEHGECAVESPPPSRRRNTHAPPQKQKVPALPTSSSRSAAAAWSKCSRM